MPFEDLQPHNKEDNASDCHDEGREAYFRKSGTFNDHTSYTVCQHCERKFLNIGNTPFREIVIAEKHTGEHHHRHGDKIDETVPDFCLCSMGRHQDGYPCKNNISCNKNCQ